MDTCINYGDNRRMWISTDEGMLINRIMKLQSEYPEDIQIIKTPKENNGCLYCYMPAEYLHLAPRIKRELTDEQRQMLAEKLNEYREQKRRQAIKPSVDPDLMKPNIHGSSTDIGLPVLF